MALPLYVGKMIEQFDVSFKGWVSGKGRSSKWIEITNESKAFAAEYLMLEENLRRRKPLASSHRIALMDITTAVHHRTGLFAVIPDFPCSHLVPTLTVPKGQLDKTLVLSCVFNSFCFDFVTKRKLPYLHLSWFVLDELPIPMQIVADESIFLNIAQSAARLTLIHRCFAPEWLKLKQEYPELAGREWKHWWAVTEADRLRLRVEIDALCAGLYGLDPDDFDWIVHDDPTDPKGFWRVDKTLPFAERLTGLAARAFRALKDGDWTAESAATLSNDEFFELLGIPELTSESAARAKGFDRPLILKRHGCHSWKPEFFSKDDSRHGWTWDDCHADAIALLGSEEELEKYLKDEQPQNPASDPGAVDMFGHPLKVNLFGEEAAKSKRKG